MSTAETLDLAQAQAPRLVTEIPGPNARARIERDRKVTSPSLPRAYDLVPARGAGSVVEDVDGNRFLDLNAGIAVTSTGHAHPEVVAAIQRQAEQLLHYSASDFYLPIYSDVCEELDRIAPFGEGARSFLTNSGTEAVEGAIKLARYATGRQYVVAMLGSFHGRSYGSVSLTASKAKYHAGFGPLLPGIVHTPFGDFEHLEQVVFKRLVPAEEVAAIIVEPIQGEGGYVMPPDGWLPYLRELCDRHGILLVADEVQTGMGRTGRMWASEHFGLEPDVVLAGKGIASGMPLGALIARERLMTWDVGAHGSTYGGNPLSCAAALATLELIEHGLIDNARDVGAVLLDGLRQIQARQPSIREVRGLGLMIGVAFVDHDTMEDVEQAAFRRGLLVLGCGDDVIRMCPPLVFRRDQADAALQIFENAITDVASGA
ncbi:MAG TPA: aminotransferase class III-fold pyridoxal phosphate-dependent enzyme [Actinomycetota bacterium]|nr:aminotransferase class III-fold pyridoxal phosphate-dependent enzyme [Actinomycetota bacterium]